MANNTVPEVPAANKPDALTPPLTPGLDHPALLDQTRKTIAVQMGVLVEKVTPADETAQKVAQSSIEDYLSKMGAKKPEPVYPPEKPDDGLTKIKQDLGAFNPLEEETDRTGPGNIPADLKEERKKKMEADKII